MSQRFTLSSNNNSLRDRSGLLGNPDAQGFPHSTSPFGGSSRQRSVEEIESQNDEHLEGLSAKVKILKDITVGIGTEIRDSTVQLSQMNDAFAETGGILSGTFRRMNSMAERQGCRWLWYIVFLIIVFWFFIIVWWIRR